MSLPLTYLPKQFMLGLPRLNKRFGNNISDRIMDLHLSVFVNQRRNGHIGDYFVVIGDRENFMSVSKKYKMWPTLSAQTKQGLLT